MMFINFYIARPACCFILMYTCGLTDVIKRVFYVMLPSSAIAFFSSINPFGLFRHVARNHTFNVIRVWQISYREPFVWHNLPLSIRSFRSFNQFTSHLKTRLFASQ